MKIALTIRRVAAFTLVEVALALAIIGFALVAIIGSLPFGLNVQRENREETIIVQDANFFLDTIRNGARGLDDLTNYVDAITNYVTGYTVVNGATSVVFNVYAYTYTNGWLNGVQNSEYRIRNGERIVGLLSTPRLILPKNSTPIPSSFTSNYVVAYIRALSGPAIEKSPQANAIVRDLAFRYRLIPEINQFNDWNLNWVNFNEPGLTTNEIVIRSNAWRMAQGKQANLNEIRLLFRWPIDTRGNAGNQRQVFRTMASGISY
jgi:type II secretory pathway pseudopilin PulG